MQQTHQVDPSMRLNLSPIPLLSNLSPIPLLSENDTNLNISPNKEQVMKISEYEKHRLNEEIITHNKRNLFKIDVETTGH